jgi:CheY-like chemotaxis protein
MAQKVLIVDDDPEYVDGISSLLEGRGYEVVTASDGKEGLMMAKQERPDLILLDVMMTTRSEGFDVARELHADEGLKDTPVIIMTGIREEMELPFGFEPSEEWLPVRQVLEKPVEPEDLLKVVEDNIGKRRGTGKGQ